MSDSLWPHGLQHTRLPCLLPTPGAYSNSCPLSRWCHPTISSSVIPFSSRLQSFLASGSFPMSQFFASGDQSIGVSALASVLPMNIQDWFPLGLTALISLLSKGLSRDPLVSILCLFGIFNSVHFSRSVMSDSLRPHESQHARLPCPSPTPGVHSNSCPLSQWSPSPPAFNLSQHQLSFHMSQFFSSGGQSIGVLASVSVLPMNIQDWFPLGCTGWISLQSKGL